ncbi:cache domain-containing sensor histidine kinase [Paenibacillus flagellatus]|uniref:histidine kinase n=1 Tax=Paenibacillus flagellatus TaxID=2211139 RepID=A0A2V5JZE1_9BACL|nr:sensor histidine kinase [Paenibacillus flagellatus]PYI52111.1 helicase Ski2 [Paenibacillus flagellatus]
MRIPFSRLVPHTLKNRLIAAFLLLVLLPFALLNAYYFGEMESVMQRKAGEQDKRQLESLKRSLEDFTGTSVKTLTLLEQDPTVTAILANPGQYDPWNRRTDIEAKFLSIGNSLFLTGSQVYYTLLDLQGNLYASYTPERPLDYADMIREPWYRDMLERGERTMWRTSDPNYVKKDVSRSAYLASLCAVLNDGKTGKPYALLRISLDYEQWFKRETGGADGAGKERALYYIVNSRGETVLESSPGQRLPQAVADRIAAAGGSPDGAGVELLDEAGQAAYTASYMKSLDWYIVKSTPLDLLFAEANALKRRFFLVFLGLTLLFMAITVLLSSSVTRPLKRLERKMKTMADNDLKVALPETRAVGEVLSLTRSFNRMVKDIHDLVHRLKREERQKQAVRFQVLVSQMNPHFLLNTLNTIKSIAMSRDDEETHEICVSLGKLLESSLNLDVDLIHLKEELELVRAYLHIQNSRFGRRFESAFELDPRLEYALVPKSSLQPLVENAIVHGFGRSMQSGKVTVRASAADNRLVLEVEDDGIGLEAAAARPRRSAGSGIGLSNLRERLQLLYQGGAELKLAALERGTSVRMDIPLLLATPYSKEDDHDAIGSVGRG